MPDCLYLWLLDSDEDESDLDDLNVPRLTGADEMHGSRQLHIAADGVRGPYRDVAPALPNQRIWSTAVWG